jgi:hypothetical protein
VSPTTRRTEVSDMEQELAELKARAETLHAMTVFIEGEVRTTDEALRARNLRISAQLIKEAVYEMELSLARYRQVKGASDDAAI